MLSLIVPISTTLGMASGFLTNNKLAFVVFWSLMLVAALRFFGIIPV
jgi:hypothetical protein